MVGEIEVAREDASGRLEFSWANFRLPPFPQAAMRALQMVNDDDASMHQFSNLIASDPALSCEVLIIANSALLAQRHRVTSILQAVLLLGTRSLKGVCLTVAVRAYLGKQMRYPTLRAIWRHSLACALIAEQLADKSRIDKGAAYTGGVVHELGQFALAVLCPQQYAALLNSHCGPATSMLERERMLFGFDHLEAGRHLIEEWNLPVEFDAMLVLRDCARDAVDSWELHDVVHMGCRLADTAGFPAFPGCEVTPYAELMDEIPVRVRSLFHADVKRLAFDVGNKIHAIEAR